MEDFSDAADLQELQFKAPADDLERRALRLTFTLGAIVGAVITAAASVLALALFDRHVAAALRDYLGV